MLKVTPSQSPAGQDAAKLANQLLAQAGYDWSGRPKPDSEEAFKQAAFEGRMVRTPTGGVNGKHR